MINDTNDHVINDHVFILSVIRAAIRSRGFRVTSDMQSLIVRGGPIPGHIKVSAAITEFDLHVYANNVLVYESSLYNFDDLLLMDAIMRFIYMLGHVDGSENESHRKVSGAI